MVLSAGWETYTESYCREGEPKDSLDQGTEHPTAQWTAQQIIDAPEPRELESHSMAEIIALPQVGGLHHRYTRRAA